VFPEIFLDVKPPREGAEYSASKVLERFKNNEVDDPKHIAH
jgi:hypothetical protein